MDRISLRLCGSRADTKLSQIVEIEDGENYYLALSRSLKKAQDDLNALLSDIVDNDKKRSQDLRFSADQHTKMPRKNILINKIILRHKHMQDKYNFVNTNHMKRKQQKDTEPRKKSKKLKK